VDEHSSDIESYNEDDMYGSDHGMEIVSESSDEPEEVGASYHGMETVSESMDEPEEVGASYHGMETVSESMDEPEEVGASQSSDGGVVSRKPCPILSEDLILKC
jgi:hypothetical protein